METSAASSGIVASDDSTAADGGVGSVGADISTGVDHKVAAVATAAGSE